MVIGVALLVIGAVVGIYAGLQSVPEYAYAYRFMLFGLFSFGSGYGLYLLTAALATLVYIERNTRGILNN